MDIADGGAGGQRAHGNREHRGQAGTWRTRRRRDRQGDGSRIHDHDVQTVTLFPKLSVTTAEMVYVPAVRYVCATDVVPLSAPRS